MIKKYLLIFLYSLKNAISEIVWMVLPSPISSAKIPLIPVSESFNAVETYTAFHQSLLDYMEKGYIDSILATSLTESSTAVLSALKANDVNSALSNLKDVKMLVEGKKDKPQPLIIKELRKILKFNLKFINTKLNS